MTISVDIVEGHVEARDRELALALIEALQAEEPEPASRVRRVIVLPDDGSRDSL